MHRRTFLLATAAFPSLLVAIAACGDSDVLPGDTTTTGAATSAPPSSAATSSTTPGGGPVPGSVPESITYPTGADDVVVRVARLGGFVPAGVAFSEVPDVLITGDGRLFRPGAQVMIFPGPILPPISLGSITPTGIERLLAVAATEGLLTEPVPEYTPNSQVADASATVVDLQANRLQLHHQADALGFVPDGQGDPDKELTPERQHLLRFVNAALDLPTTVGAGELGPDEIWAPTSFRVQARVAEPSTTATDEPQPTVVAWPAGTGVRLAEAATCVVGSGDVLASTLAAADTLTFFTEDGLTYQVSAVGQLPGTGC